MIDVTSIVIKAPKGVLLAAITTLIASACIAGFIVMNQNSYNTPLLFAMAQSFMVPYFTVEAIIDFHNRKWLGAAFMGIAAIASFGTLGLIAFG